MKICFFTKYQITWGSSRERIGGYLGYIKDRGYAYEVIYVIPNNLSKIWISGKRRDFLFTRIYSFWYSRIFKHLKLIWLIIIAKRFNIIIIQKVTLIYPLVWILRARNRNIIFDFDDQCFYDSLEGGQKKRFSLIKKINFWRKGIQHPAILRLYSYIIAGNRHLANTAVAIKGKENIAIIPTPVDCSIYFPKAISLGKASLTIGWAGSGENHLRHLELLEGPFRELLKKQYNFTFKLVGAMYSGKIKALFKLLNSKFICIDWVDDYAQLPRLIQTFDIGVMPLRDDEESRGKCGFKVLQYMASGVPVVISPIGVNKEIVKDGINGFLAKDEGEWIKKLSFLISDENLRDRFAEEGRKTIEESYSLNKTSNLFIEVIKKIVCN